jgi:hypothetical protein
MPTTFATSKGKKSAGFEAESRASDEPGTSLVLLSDRIKWLKVAPMASATTLERYLCPFVQPGWLARLGRLTNTPKTANLRLRLMVP